MNIWEEVSSEELRQAYTRQRRTTLVCVHEYTGLVIWSLTSGVREPCRQCDGGLYGLEAGLQALDCMLVASSGRCGGPVAICP